MARRCRRLAAPSSSVGAADGAAAATVRPTGGGDTRASGLNAATPLLPPRKRVSARSSRRVDSDRTPISACRSWSASSKSAGPSIAAALKASTSEAQRIERRKAATSSSVADCGSDRSRRRAVAVATVLVCCGVRIVAAAYLLPRVAPGPPRALQAVSVSGSSTTSQFPLPGHGGAGVSS